MPRYTYECKKCSGVFEEVHSIADKYVKCAECKDSKNCDGELIRIPSVLRKNNIKQNTNVKTGTVVNSSIKEFNELLKQQKEDLKGKIYDE